MFAIGTIAVLPNGLHEICRAAAGSQVIADVEIARAIVE